MNKPVVSQAGDREGLRERQKQKQRHEGQAQLVYHGSLEMGGGGHQRDHSEESGTGKTASARPC